MHFLIHSGLIFPPQYTIYGEGVREEQYQQDRLYLSHLRLRIRLRGGRDGGLEELDLDDLVHVRQRLNHLAAPDGREECRIPTRGRGGVSWGKRIQPRQPSPVPAGRTQGRAVPPPRQTHLDVLRHYKDIYKYI